MLFHQNLNFNQYKYSLVSMFIYFSLRYFDFFTILIGWKLLKNAYTNDMLRWFWDVDFYIIEMIFS